MTKKRTDGLILVLLGAVAFLVIGIAWRRVSPIEMGDFKVVYYSARCLLQHTDPYSELAVVRVYQAEGRENPVEPALDRQVKTRFFYPPSAFVVTLPFALIGFAAGKVLWTILLAASFILASILAYDLGADFAPLVSGALAGLLLVNSFWLYMIGNSAAIAVSFCVIAVWCFFRERFVWAGVCCLAISLALKPNDSGLVWLCLLLIGGSFRKRALQTLLVFAALSLPIVLWVSRVSPHWFSELRANMASFSGVGSIVDPASTGMAGRNMDSLVQLQSFVSIFFSQPAAYNLICWIVCAPLVLFSIFIALHPGRSTGNIWLVLAVAAPLSMLPTYHLQHDAKILMLTIPACSMLWSRRRPLGRIALLLTTLVIVINGDIFSGIRIVLTRSILIPRSDFPSRLATAVLTRPAPVALLAIAVFFLWVYLRVPHNDQEFIASPEMAAGTNRNHAASAKRVHNLDGPSALISTRTAKAVKGGSPC